MSFASRKITAQINGIGLTGAAPMAIIREVWEDPAESDLTTGEKPLRPGLRVLGFKRTRLNVRIDFVLKDINNLSARSAALDAVNTWATDGLLYLSNKPGKQLPIIITKHAALNAMRDYTQVYTVECAAIGCPYWQNVSMSTAAVSGSSGNVALTVSGNLENMPLEFSLSGSGGLSSLTVSLNGKSMSFSGLSVPAGTPLILRYDENMLQWITAGGGSVVSSRSGTSADDLFAHPGSNTISFSANTSLSGTFRVRGLWK